MNQKLLGRLTRCFLLAACFVAILPRAGKAETEEFVTLFFCPPGFFYSEAEPPIEYPAVETGFPKDFLLNNFPDKIIDVSSVFGPKGVKGLSVAWYCDARRMLVIKSNQDYVELAEVFLHSMMWDPPQNLCLNGKLSAKSQSKAGKEVNQFRIVKWEMTSQSGHTVRTALESDSYLLKLDCSSVLGADGDSVDFTGKVEGKYRERNFSTTFQGSAEMAKEFVVLEIEPTEKELGFRITLTPSVEFLGLIELPENADELKKEFEKLLKTPNKSADK